ncbi:MAG: hypothetical protein HYZ28_15405 [Myxococcales bacterium]|nr:hypothetical protein [Myxococcales bacterium]
MELRASLAVLLAATAARADYMDHFVVREDVGLHKAPYLGDAELLLIPVEVAGHPPLDMPAIRDFFSEGAPGGFVQYFRTASLGRYSPKVTIAPAVQFDSCPLPLQSFPDCAVRRGDLAAFSAGMDMIRQVVRSLELSGFDFSRLDVNGRRGGPDRFADGVMILSNTPFGGIAFPFAYYNRGDNLAGGEGGPLVVDGVKISHVAISGRGDVYVMVHEFGHLIGLTDLYDESRKYEGLHFSVMGAWGYGPKIPLPDAETRFRLRWANVHQVSGSERVAIPPVESSGVVWRLGTGDEYFLIENRGPGGLFDQDLTCRGLAVYHVDRRVKLNGEEGRFQDRVLDCVNCDPWHPYIRIVQADGKFDLQKGGWPECEEDLFREGDQLLPDSSGAPLSESHQVQSTNWYSGEGSLFALRDVHLRRDGSVEVSFQGPAVDQCGDPLCAEGPGCQPVTCKARGCQSGPGEVALLAAAATALAARRRQRFLKSASAASKRARCCCCAPAPPSPIWKNSQKFAASLSVGTSANGSLHSFAAERSK